MEDYSTIGQESRVMVRGVLRVVTGKETGLLDETEIYVILSLEIELTMHVHGQHFYRPMNQSICLLTNRNRAIGCRPHIVFPYFFK